MRALFERIAGEPTGAVQLARMAEIEETSRSPASPRVTRLLVLACVAAFALQAWLGPGVHHAGFFSAPLATRGEPWRLMTANLLHAGPEHLVLNLIGSVRTRGRSSSARWAAHAPSLIAGLAALGSSLAGLYDGYEALVGASGIVAGFAGALVWLEFRLPERLPAQWRVPRRLFLGALLLDAALPLLPARDRRRGAPRRLRCRGPRDGAGGRAEPAPRGAASRSTRRGRAGARDPRCFDRRRCAAGARRNGMGEPCRAPARSSRRLPC